MALATKEQLEELYLNQNMSSGEIAKQLGCGKTWIGKLLKKYDLLNKKSKEDRKRRTFENVAKTNQIKYGGASPFSSKEIRQKAQNTLNERYGCSQYNQIHLPLRTQQLINNKELLKAFLEQYKEKPNLYDLVEELGISHSQLNKRIKQYDLQDLVNYFPVTSKIEKALMSLFDQYSITYKKDRTILDGQEIDLYLPDLKIGIEVNGNYWHSTEFKEHNYHQKKSLLAQDKGVFLYHLFEYEWYTKPEQVINQIKNLIGVNDHKIYARKCEVKEVKAKEAKEFLNKYHLQGSDNASIRYGLYYDNSLVQIMTFCKPRFNKNYEWELSRLCSKETVVGGASKLFKHFIRQYNPTNILSYSDITHTRGNIYPLLGFVFSHISKPNYIWCRGKRKYLTRYQCQKHKLIEQFPQYKDLSESEIMNCLGYEKIEDCGNKVWIWHK